MEILKYLNKNSGPTLNSFNPRTYLLNLGLQKSKQRKYCVNKHSRKIRRNSSLNKCEQFSLSTQKPSYCERKNLYKISKSFDHKPVSPSYQIKRYTNFLRKGTGIKNQTFSQHRRLLEKLKQKRKQNKTAHQNLAQMAKKSPQTENKGKQKKHQICVLFRIKCDHETCKLDCFNKQFEQFLRNNDLEILKGFKKIIGRSNNLSNSFKEYFFALLQNSKSKAEIKQLILTKIKSSIPSHLHKKYMKWFDSFPDYNRMKEQAGKEKPKKENVHESQLKGLKKKDINQKRNDTSVQISKKSITHLKKEQVEDSLSKNREQKDDLSESLKNSSSIKMFKKSLSHKSKNNMKILKKTPNLHEKQHTSFKAIKKHELKKFYSFNQKIEKHKLSNFADNDSLLDYLSEISSSRESQKKNKKAYITQKKLVNKSSQKINLELEKRANSEDEESSSSSSSSSFAENEIEEENWEKEFEIDEKLKDWAERKRNNKRAPRSSSKKKRKAMNSEKSEEEQLRQQNSLYQQKHFKTPLIMNRRNIIKRPLNAQFLDKKDKKTRIMRKQNRNSPLRRQNRQLDQEIEALLDEINNNYKVIEEVENILVKNDEQKSIILNTDSKLTMNRKLTKLSNLLSGGRFNPDSEQVEKYISLFAKNKKSLFSGENDEKQNSVISSLLLRGLMRKNQDLMFYDLNENNECENLEKNFKDVKNFVNKGKMQDPVSSILPNGHFMNKFEHYESEKTRKPFDFIHFSYMVEDMINQKGLKEEESGKFGDLIQQGLPKKFYLEKVPIKF